MARQDQNQKNASDLGEQAIALAEQLGRIAGRLEGTAESWLNQQTLAEQLTRVRDGATQMLEGLTAGAERGGKAASTVVRAVPASAKVTAGIAKARAYLASGGGRSGGKAKGAKPAARTTMAKADPSHAPGKRHRKPAPTMHGVKKSDERIPKMRLAEANRQRRKSHA
ncbi:MAG: hypothetical protein ABIS29_11170 [Vicinamibacterales bacterium]